MTIIISMERINKAFTNIHRRDFMPEAIADSAHIDSAMPIGFGQTISQPYTVEKMLEWLDVRPGNKILDVGAGSAWTSALLAFLATKKGYVYGVERIPELLNFGQQNLRRSKVFNAKLFQAGKILGLREHAPYDRILVSASAKELPIELLNQLKNGGKMVIPVGSDILEITKTVSGHHKTIVHSGFIFVPLL